MVRWADKREFSLPLNALAPTDKAFLAGLPVFQPTPQVASRSAKSNPSPESSDKVEHRINLPGASFDLRRIDGFYEDLEEVKEESEGLPRDSIRYKSIITRANDIKDDIDSALESLIVRTENKLADLPPDSPERDVLSQALDDLTAEEKKANIRFAQMKLRRPF